MDHIIKAWEHRTGNDISNYLYLFALYALRSDKATFCKAQITEGCNPFLGGSTITTLDPSSQWTGSTEASVLCQVMVQPRFGGSRLADFSKDIFDNLLISTHFTDLEVKKKSWNTWIKEAWHLEGYAKSKHGHAQPRNTWIREAWHLEGYAKSKHGHAQPRLTQKYFSRLETTGLLNQAHMF
jgi:hypothetical protein